MLFFCMEFCKIFRSSKRNSSLTTRPGGNEGQFQTFLSFPHCAHMRFLAHLCVVLLKRAVCIYISSDVYAYLEEKEGEEESHMSAV